MKKVVVMGAGLVSRPLVKYLLDVDNVFVTLGDMDINRAEHIIGGAENGAAISLDVNDTPRLESLIAGHDLAVSLLPYEFHPVVADCCIRHKKNMVTASYVSDRMRALDEAARTAGVIVLNEIGLDPGIDHMSAMRVIDDVHDRGGGIESFRSCCGGLPAPDDNDNPFGYKFSWSPKGVLMAGRNDARYLEDKKIVEIPGKNLFLNHEKFDLPGFGALEAYPNRNSIPYVDVYGIPEARTMFRGTIRNAGWCDKLFALSQLGLLQDITVDLPQGAAFCDLTRKMIGAGRKEDLGQALEHFLGEDARPGVVDGLRWLGLLDDRPLPATDNLLDIMAQTFAEKMTYTPGQRDMIILYHDFVAVFAGGRQRVTSTLIDYGIKNGDSAMARTVGLPAAIGAEMILNGKIKTPGVQIPVTPSIYLPVLERLETLGIRCVETVCDLG